MNSAGWMGSAGPLVAVAASMVGVPLTVIVFYLRSLRENLLFGQQSLARRIEAQEAAGAELRRAISDLPRDYTTKEEWLRELLHTRRVLEEVKEASIRVQTTLDDMRHGVARTSARLQAVGSSTSGEGV